MPPSSISRRDALKVGAAAGVGILIAFYLPGTERFDRLLKHAQPLAPNAWLRVGPDGAVTIFVDKSEMGQGVRTALAMILADELDADWSRVAVEQAVASAAFEVLRHGRMSTGGSTSVRTSWDPLRKAGAQARAMLVHAAAAAWGVPADQCTTDRGTVVHASTRRVLDYGALAERAASLPVPIAPALKSPRAYRLIGRSLPRLDAPAKVTGSARFGIDVTLPGLLTAVVARCPVWGGSVASFRDERALAVPGVRSVVPVTNGVAVVADGFWPARTGRDLLDVTWNEGANAGATTDAVWAAFADRASRPGVLAYSRGDAPTVDQGAVRAEYRLPYLAHAGLEPQNCTAHVRAGACDVWAPTQNQSALLDAAERVTGLPRSAITVHTTLLGGGFGRRLDVDYAAEALEIARRVGAPVKVVFTREDDTRHDSYRPASLHRLSAVLDRDGWPAAWSHRVTANSVLARWAPASVAGGVDRDQIRGCGEDLPYAIPALRLECAIVDAPVRVGWWRSVGQSSTTFVVESFLDELAAAGRKDPLEVRRRLLLEAPRHLAVLDLAATAASWGAPLPPGRARGIALLDGFGSIVAQVAEVSLDGGTPRVHRVACAIDCGRVIHPGLVEAQMISGIIFGLGAALREEITLANGRVQQGSFADYPVPRMNDVPRVDVHIVPSEERPGGVGEAAVPCVAPAVANALFALTGQRARRLPLAV